MKALLAGVLLLPALAVAQQDYAIVEKQVICGETKKVLEYLYETYNERPIWMGIGSDSRYSLLVDPKTGNWTLIQFNQDVVCIVGAGADSKEIPSGPRT